MEYIIIVPYKYAASSLHWKKEKKIKNIYYFKFDYLMSITAQVIEITSNVLKSVEWKGASAEEKEETQKIFQLSWSFQLPQAILQGNLGDFFKCPDCVEGF